MKLNHFDYNLPKDLIAQEPLTQRDSSRLLVLDRKSQTFKEAVFKDAVGYLKSGDCLVFNDTKVIHARLMGKRKTGGKIEVFLYEKIDGATYKVLLKPGNKVKPKDKIFFNDRFEAEIDSAEGGFRIARFFCNDDIDEEIENIGEVPLPPYIKRPPVQADKSSYQTVYARNRGACAAPTAGLHFTKELLKDIAEKGVKLVYVTLHVSYGTFAPIKTDAIENHKMHSEYFVLSSEAADIVNKTKQQGKSVIAVGTTSARVLESCSHAGTLKAREGWTDLFIYPPYEFKMVDKLITNLHIPKSTLLLLVSAFAGRDLIFKAYDYAIKEKFRFFSYGDAMLII